MDTILELGESHNGKYPQHFQVFLENCIKKYKRDFEANDYLFSAVYFIVLETGFNPIELCNYSSISFDIRKLRCVTSFNENHIKISNQFRKSKSHVYQIPLGLGKYSSGVCELQGVPSSEPNTHIIINLLSKQPHVVRSLCLNTDTYVEKNDNNSEQKYILKNLKDLSVLVKTKMSVHVKDLILTNEEEGCGSNLLCLPEEIQRKIVFFLKDDFNSIQCLSSTCSYFYNFISKDVRLWEKICLLHFNPLKLTVAVQELVTSNEENVFRSAFFKLKLNEAARYYR